MHKKNFNSTYQNVRTARFWE